MLAFAGAFSYSLFRMLPLNAAVGEAAVSAEVVEDSVEGIRVGLGIADIPDMAMVIMAEAIVLITLVLDYPLASIPIFPGMEGIITIRIRPTAPTRLPIIPPRQRPFFKTVMKDRYLNRAITPAMLSIQPSIMPQCQYSYPPTMLKSGLAILLCQNRV